MDQAIVGKFIQHLRKEHGMTQKQLAGEIGVSDKTISKWENGNGLPDLESLYALSSFFRISINELLAGEKKAADNYQQKAEEVIVDLIKENQKLRGLHIALGVFIGCASIFIFGIQEFGTSIRSYLPSYFDLSSMLILLMLCYPIERGKGKEKGVNGDYEANYSDRRDYCVDKVCQAIIIRGIGRKHSCANFTEFDSNDIFACHICYKRGSHVYF